MILGTNRILLKRFSRSVVKGQGRRETKCTSAAEASVWHRGLPISL